MHIRESSESREDRANNCVSATQDHLSGMPLLLLKKILIRLLRVRGDATLHFEECFPAEVHLFDSTSNDSICIVLKIL